MTDKTRLSRRQFLRIAAFMGVAGGAAGLGLAGRSWDSAEVSETRLLMGTIANLTVIAPDREQARAAVAATFERMSALESVLSRFRPDGQLTQLNRAGSLAPADPALLALLRQAEQVSRLTGGAFDVTIKPAVDLYQRYQAEARGLPPADEVRAALALVGYTRIVISGTSVRFADPNMAITLDGIAKGHIVDAGVAVLRAHGFANVLVEAGGDLLGAGHKASGQPWQVGVQSPRKSHAGLMATFGMEDRAAATSGDYMQPFTPDFAQHHILDPRTGYSSPQLASATAMAPTAALADALATALMVLGPQAGLEALKSMPGCEALMITKDLQIVRSPGLRAA